MHQVQDASFQVTRGIREHGKQVTREEGKRTKYSE